MIPIRHTRVPEQINSCSLSPIVCVFARCSTFSFMALVRAFYAQQLIMQGLSTSGWLLVDELLSLFVICSARVCMCAGITMQPRSTEKSAWAIDRQTEMRRKPGKIPSPSGIWDAFKLLLSKCHAVTMKNQNRSEGGTKNKRADHGMVTQTKAPAAGASDSNFLHQIYSVWLPEEL